MLRAFRRGTASRTPTGLAPSKDEDRIASLPLEGQSRGLLIADVKRYFASGGTTIPVYAC